MRVLLVAGEASGDVHAAKVARILLQRGAQITAVGGHHLNALDIEPIAHIDELAVLGISEVFRRLPQILRVRRRIEQQIRAGKHDILLTVDYPGLNLRLARTAHRNGMPVLHYIGPQVWAWRAHRLRTMQENVDCVALVLPFEESLYRQAGVPASFVGHPLLEDEYAELEQDCDLALFPGSRRQEVLKHLPVLLEAAALFKRQHGAFRLQVSLASMNLAALVRPLLVAHGFVPEETLTNEPAGRLMRRTRASLVASGTATLEAALAGRPFAVFYRTSALTFAIARRLVKVPWVSLANLVAEAPVVHEYLQNDFRAETLVAEIQRLLLDEKERQRIQVGCATVRRRLGDAGASQRVADLVQQLVDAPRAAAAPVAVEGPP